MIRFPSICKLISLNGVQNACGIGVKQISTRAFPLQFKATPALWAEPLKKKKRMDPAILKFREERKKKKILKEIRRLQKLDRKLKPVSEIEVPKCLKEEPEKRQRVINVPAATVEQRILLLKEWTKYKYAENQSDAKILKKLINSQQKALNELRLVSEDLYQAAVKIDPNLIPLKYTGPSETPVKEDYHFPDGVYIDISRKWV